jgi:hypothetical protein
VANTRRCRGQDAHARSPRRLETLSSPPFPFPAFFPIFFFFLRLPFATVNSSTNNATTVPPSSNPSRPQKRHPLPFTLCTFLEHATVG